MKNLALVSGFGLFLVSSLHAQTEAQRFSFDIGVDLRSRWGTPGGI
jgi:hypothetical protein